ncbi:helix-turn-helix transcriptional regulator [Paenibacillus flagellatus]|uniref:PadR family transcriptional regulator n=1 Tax=Paenibacillus flagellatus TaxID=2211139 RepID=A0A2V5JVH8_9BACL|nr:helix-turn-helix transcriptional regulator [Paenibacillus flagellatus]PYI50481.1 hypothetical protein DLM86_28685 [Paenibacillus flagellatus]
MTSQDVILGMLMLRSCSGYDLKMRFEAVFSYFFDASYGTIYPTLAKLEKDGLITKESVAQEGKPNKNVYSITERGRAAFESYLNSDIQNDAIKSDYLVRLFFGEMVDPAVLIGWLEKGIEKTERQAAKLQADYERWEAGMSPSQRICIEIGISNYTSRLEVLRRGLARLKEALEKE